VIIIYPDGRIENVTYTDYTSIHAAVNPPGRDDAFTAVPLRESHRCGYTVYVNEVGLHTNMPVNEFAERLCDYAPLVGPAVIVTHEESNETDLLGDLIPECRESFKRRLGQVILWAKEAVAKAKAQEN
jgi:hypothetical protein